LDYPKAKLVRALVAHFDTDDRRVEHALRVMAWAEEIMRSEQADREIVLAVALLHDVGITEAVARHGTSPGRLQEKYGRDIAAALLAGIGFPPEKIPAVREIVSKHHTRHGVDSPEFRILWDSDLLVNTADSPNLDRAKLAAKIDGLFETEAGRELAKREFGVVGG
jgi:HD superfamily phosphodiesterase